MNLELNKLPMNIQLLILNQNNTAGMGEVKVLDSMEGASKTFHPHGLYSTEIFGKVGDEKRNRLYGFIDLGIEIFHPLIFRTIVKLKELYGRIMSGTAYAVFDEKLKDFVPASIKDGSSGYSFFLEHFDKIVFEERPSTSRQFSIDLIKRYQGKLMMSRLLVLPAGLRDYVLNENGKPEEDEINNLYRRVLSIATIIRSQAKLKDLSHLDATRYSLQNAVQEIYQYILNLVEGKHKLVEGHWTARNIHYSTRNVITASVPRLKELGDELSITVNHTQVGLYQFMMSIFPLAAFHVREYASKVFQSAQGHALLVDKKTLEQVHTTVPSKRYDEWMTQEGLEVTMGRFESELLRHDPIEVEGYYFGLIYNDGKRVKFLQSIQDLPDGFDKKYVSPITYAELYYLAIYQKAREIPAFVTRYPVIEMGSVYPTWTYLRSTAKSVILDQLGDDWETVVGRANEFPIRGEPFFNSLAVAPSHLARLGGDHDGDTMSYTPIMTDEGIADVRKLLNSSRYYLSPNGGVNFSTSTTISDLVFAELTN